MSVATDNGAARKIQFEWRLSMGNVLTLIMMAVGGLSVWFALGERVTVAENNIVNHQTDIADISDRVQRAEDRAGDVRERLAVIESIHKEQSRTLERILQAVQGDQ